MRKGGTEDNNYSKKRTLKKIGQSDSKKKAIIGDDGMNFPQVKPMFKRNKFFQKIHFQNLIKKQVKIYQMIHVMDQWIIREENMIK